MDVSTGKPLGPNETGEVCVLSPLTMIGYINNPKATCETIDQDGWIHTGLIFKPITFTIIYIIIVHFRLIIIL